MKILFKTLKIFFLTVLVLLIIFNIYTLGIKIRTKEKVAMTFGYSILNVISGSMEPTIKVGSIIIIRQQKNYYINDIITYKDENNSIITHRVVAKEVEELTTKGDINTNEDKPIKKEQIYGKVVYFSYKLGFIFGHLKTPVFWIILISITFCTKKYMFKQ